MPLYLPKDLDAPILSLFSLVGKIAVVTGGSRGIGIQVVTALAKAGADVAFVFHTSPDAEAIAANISQKTGRIVRAHSSDMTDRARIASTIQEITETFGCG